MAARYQQATALEHMRNQTSMYLGGKDVIRSREYIMQTDGTIALQDVELCPAALKCFDEILVNAIDQYTQNNTAAIEITYTADEITITNSATSIEIYETETRDGRRMYSPQMIFGEFMTSSNFDLTKDSITGGVFGTGAKGVNAFSERFEIETYDPKSDRLYWQQWRSCMSEVSEPEITDNPAEKLPFVAVTFRLSYADFHMQAPAVFAHFEQLCRMRVLHTASFCRSRVTWNGERVVPANPKELAALYCAQEKSRRVAFELCSNTKRDLRWSVIVATKENEENLESISIVNGIYVKKGTHLTYIADQIVEYIKPLWIELKDPTKKAAKVQKIKEIKDKKKAKEALGKFKSNAPKFDKRYVLKYLFILITGYINKPSFTGQRKDEIDSPQSQFADYTISRTHLEEIWSMIKPLIEFDIFAKLETDSAKPAKKIKARQYTAAKYAGTARAALATLFIAEGNSAFGTVDNGISSKASALDFNRYGIYSIQGVPMNARKKITTKTNPITGQTVKVRNAELRNNERLSTMVAILNLDYNKTYASATERATISYGAVIIAADQDEDGKGNIRSQLFNFFWTFWPELVHARFVKFLITPIVRAIHRRGREAIQEFYTEEAFRAWADAKGDIAEYECVYYKGLGSHGETETDNMFKNFDRLVITYTADSRTETACEAYFGEDADMRKLVLVNPPQNTEEKYYTAERTISATHHLNTETKSYQIYNISRHIKHIIDGGLPSKRKIWAGARQVLSGNNQRIKVYQLAGKIAEKMNYHHGDASLNNTITHSVQNFPGANEFPFLLALSNFGTRKKGGEDAGEPRYTFTKLNKHLSDAMFPPIDDYILNYTFDDGKRGEPEYYVPVVPLAILEHYQSPAHGWACNVWARDYWQISDAVRACITTGTYDLPAGQDFMFTRNRFRHDLQRINGVENSVGRYTRSGNTITITELPVRIWNENFLHGNPKGRAEGVADADYITEYDDRSTKDDTNIVLKFKKGFLDTLPAAVAGVDPVVRLLDLKQSLTSNLNFIGLNGSVQECREYADIFDAWYDVRELYYKKRIERMSVILDLRLAMYREMVRYIECRERLGISGKTKAVQNEILDRTKFTKFNKTLLDRPSYTPVADLRRLILDGSFDYLRKMDADDLSEEGHKLLLDRCRELETELTTFRDADAVKKIWLRELSELDAVVRRGQTQGWLSWETKQTFA
jgi:DNA topoisomerase-2